jgi:phosphoglycolate phosphatase-like HAD superfamily hydrolase
VTGLGTSFDGISTAGSLDTDLIAAMMRAQGATDDLIRTSMQRIVEEAQRTYAPPNASLQRSLCPGVRAALRRIHAARVPVGLVTGNLTSIGWKKMQHAGILGYFRFGAFAEQAQTRAGLVAVALRQARRANWLRRDTVVSLIGDHPNDVTAARLNGIRSVAVATGVAGRASLVRCRPDVLLPDLRCLRLEMLL